MNDVTQDVVKNFRPHWKDRYLTSNVYFKDLNNNKTVPIGYVHILIFPSISCNNVFTIVKNTLILKASSAHAYWPMAFYSTFLAMEICRLFKQSNMKSSKSGLTSP